MNLFTVGGFINPWTGEEIPGMAGMGPISDDHDEDSLHGKLVIFSSISLCALFTNPNVSY